MKGEARRRWDAATRAAALANQMHRRRTTATREPRWAILSRFGAGRAHLRGGSRSRSGPTRTRWLRRGMEASTYVMRASRWGVASVRGDWRHPGCRGCPRGTRSNSQRLGRRRRIASTTSEILSRAPRSLFTVMPRLLAFFTDIDGKRDEGVGDRTLDGHSQ